MNYDNILIFTSLIFITNAISGLYNKKYFYSFLFTLLTITSINVHCDYNNHNANILDKLVICLILFYGLYVFLKNLKKNIISSIIVLSTFLITAYLYVYGFFVNNFCFHEDIHISRKYHMLMHAICCFGNHSLLFLH
jgi:hypothetical protein